MKFLPSILAAFSLAWTGSGLAGAASAAGASAPVQMPGPVALSRYQAMIDASPFAPATPPPAPVAPVVTASFAQDLYVTGIAKLGDSDFVTVSSKDQLQRFSLMVGDVGPDGITLTNVAWDPATGKSKATLKKGTEFGVITFDEATITAAAVAQQSPMAPPLPLAIPNSGGPLGPGSRMPPRRPFIPGTNGRLNRPNGPGLPGQPQYQPSQGRIRARPIMNGPQ